MSERVKRPLLAATGRNCAWQVVVLIVGAAVGVCVVAAALIAANAASNSAAPETILVPFFVLLCLGIGGMLVGAFAFAILRMRRLDEHFAPLGLSGRIYALVGRQFEGSFMGREVRVQVTRGPTLSFRVKGGPGAKWGVATRTGMGQTLRGAVGADEIGLADEAFGHLIVAGSDEGWVRRLLDDAPAREALLRVMHDEAATELRSLQMGPGALWLIIRRMPLSYLTAEKARAWLDGLVAVLDAADRLGPPAGDGVSIGPPGQGA